MSSGSNGSTDSSGNKKSTPPDVNSEGSSQQQNNVEALLSPINIADDRAPVSRRSGSASSPSAQQQRGGGGNRKRKNPQSADNYSPRSSSAASFGSETNSPRRSGSGKNTKNNKNKAASAAAAVKKNKKDAEPQKEVPLPSDSARESSLPPPLILALFVAVVGIFLYCVISLVLVMLDTSSHKTDEKTCNALTPAPGVHPTPFRLLYASTFIGVVLSIVINFAKYRWCGSYIWVQKLVGTSSKQQQEQQQQKLSNSTRSVEDEEEEEEQQYDEEYDEEYEEEEEDDEGDQQDDAEEREERRQQRAGGRRRRALNSSASLAQEMNNVPAAAGLDMALLSPREQRGGGGKKNQQQQPPTSSQQNNNSNSNSRRRRHGVYDPDVDDDNDDAPDGSLGTDSTPDLDKLALPAYLELGYILQIFGTMDARWNLAGIAFSTVLFLVLAGQQSTEPETSSEAFKGTDAWARYSTLMMRWVSSGTVQCVLVALVQMFVSFLSFDIAGMPRDLGDRLYVKRRLAALAKQQPVTLNKLMLTEPELEKKTKQQKRSDNDNEDARSNASAGSAGKHSVASSIGSGGGKRGRTAAGSLSPASDNLNSKKRSSSNKNNNKMTTAELEQSLPAELVAAEYGKIKDQRALQRVIASMCFPLSAIFPSTDLDALGFYHIVAFGGILVFPVFITHVLPAALVFCPIVLLLALPLLACYWAVQRDLAPFAALVERENASEPLCRRHRTGAVLLLVSARVLATFVLGALFMTMASLATQFFVSGGGPWAGSVANEIKYRDVPCFFAQSSAGYQMILAGLFLG